MRVWKVKFRARWDDFNGEKILARDSIGSFDNLCLKVAEKKIWEKVASFGGGHVKRFKVFNCLKVAADLCVGFIDKAGFKI